jgi:large subunit ribosomal protein L9
MIEIILRESIDHLGHRGDIVAVANGYARNYLLPQKLALLVTEANKRQIEREREIVEADEAKERQAAEDLASRISAIECVIERRVGETEALYGSVTSLDIAEYLTSQGFSIDKRKIQLNEAIKKIGEVTVSIRLHRDVLASLRVKVVQSEIDGDPQQKAT